MNDFGSYLNLDYLISLFLNAMISLSLDSSALYRYTYVESATEEAFTTEMDGSEALEYKSGALA
jgi:hypothetical protein